MKKFALMFVTLLFALLWLACRWPVEVVVGIVCFIEAARGDDNTPKAELLLSSYDSLLEKITNWVKKYTD